MDVLLNRSEKSNRVYHTGALDCRFEHGQRNGATRLLLFPPIGFHRPKGFCEKAQNDRGEIWSLPLRRYPQPHDEPYTLPSAVTSNILQLLFARLPPVVNTFQHIPNTPSQLRFTHPYFPNLFSLAPNATVNEVTKLLLYTVCSPMGLSVMLLSARSPLPKVRTLRAIIAVAQPSLICLIKDTLRAGVLSSHMQEDVDIRTTWCTNTEI
ncbi:hypothetical protein X801_09335 [Opisthorchis viverrini]|uniref:Uncharacterized protein n=1 Tax=Opisthorchis viverrini TaxID=6198 RepID=A0A1S8WKA5_OPIVI|nr:hypothetical protein X801_09335 [Opisthorchis viverrini]